MVLKTYFNQLRMLGFKNKDGDETIFGRLITLVYQMLRKGTREFYKKYAVDLAYVNELAIDKDLIAVETRNNKKRKKWEATW